jgi:hypothetical protein
MYAVRGGGRPQVGRLHALWLMGVHAAGSLVNVLRRRKSLARLRRMLTP